MSKIKLALFLTLCLVLNINAQTVETISVPSPKMGSEVKNVIILPAGYDRNANKNYPVLYLLHGYSGNHSSWVELKKELPEEASRLGMIIVCPDGKNAWYWDSPINPKMQYETYVSKELVGYIDKNYKTIQSPNGRAIAGLSMGGHGALWLAINHPDVFGACGSMSGGVDIRPFPNNWEMKKSIGSYKDNPKVWDDHTVMTQISKIEPNTLSIIIDCGTEDFFFGVNEKLHQELRYRNIKHDYIVRPGAHNGPYWQNAIDYQLLFFWKFFNRKEEKKK
ncbi:alpha/beta hydrolase family protein [Dysgonomonas sp. 520]|uniref:alpha/beta hydrolase n=1 Tax=Dysgonomonas sp. 520 TaxID=2302931 RepID=UPI0013D03C83|nr:alpha/beta hydrolase family protein [Dysgonomonas sp. 520]NDW10542.1 esterase family protein [Dysgonomonas sp. 520]